MDFDYMEELLRCLKDEETEEDDRRPMQVSIRLKSALKQWNDYLKNRSISRDAAHLSSQFDVKTLPDSVVLLPEIWKMTAKSYESGFINSVNKSFPQYDNDFMEVFCEELKMLTEGSTANLSILMDFKDRIEGLRPSLFFMALYFIFVVTVNPDSNKREIISTWKVTNVHDVKWIKFSEGLSVGVYNSLAMIRLYREVYLVHRDHLLNICDKINERLNVLIYSIIRYELSQTLYNPPSVYLSVIQWGDNIVLQLQSKGFLILSNYEALIIGLILRKGDPGLWDCHKFLNNVVSDIKDEVEGAEEMILLLLEGICSLSVDCLSDIHGLYRIWGHPEVVLKKGLEKMMNTSLAKKDLNLDNLKTSERLFKEMFCTSYYAQHHHYPLVKFLPKYSEYSDSMYVFNKILSGEKINISSGEYALEDWDYIEFEKNFEVPYTWNLAHNIKDKAVSPNRKELLHSISRGKGVIIQEYRRTVLKWLKQDMIPMKDFLNYVDEKGLPLDSLVIGLYAKERELKWFPRFFSLMSFEMRLYFVSTEQLLSENILRYFPQITMTANLLEMTKKIIKMSGRQGRNRGEMGNPLGRSKGIVNYSINIDFKKWNQQMRYETTRRVFGQIDKLFGYNSLYSQTHLLLEKSFIYLCSGEYTPHVSGNQFIVDPPWNWCGDDSGKEGLRQKGWTILTVVLIEKIMRDHDVKYQLIGGGDNQVLMVTLETELIDINGNLTPEGKEESRLRMEAIITSLDSYFSSVGLPLKINETWVSPDLFAYNKILCYQGKHLISGSKTVSRMFPFSDDSAITLSGISSTISTSLKALPSRDLGHIHAYIFSRISALWVSYVIFYMHPLIEGGSQTVEGTSFKYRFRDQECVATIREDDIKISTVLKGLLFFHRIMGGFSMGVPSDMVMRGFPDPLTSALSWNKGLIDSLNEHNQLRDFIISASSVSNGRRDDSALLHLISDPVAINHDAPLSGVAVLREVSERAIVESTEIKNMSFKELAATCHSHASVEFISALTSSKVLEPRFLHEIYGATLYGYFNSIVSRVDKSMTILRLNRSSKVLEEIIKKEKCYLAYIMMRTKMGYDLSPELHQCSRVVAETYRNISWGKIISGVTVPHPLEYLKIGNRDRHYCDDNYILLNSVEHDLEDREMGPMEPYLGSYTDEKFKLSPIAGAFGEENLLMKAIHLQKLKFWRYGGNDDLYHVISDVLTSETNVDHEDLFIHLETSSSVVHRYSDDVLHHGAILNNIVDGYRWYSMSTSTLSKRSKGGRNDMIHFQASLLWILSKNVNRKLIKVKAPLSAHYHETCCHCIVEVPELSSEDVKLSKSWSLPRMRDNPIAYIDKENIGLNYHNRWTIERYNVLSFHKVEIPEENICVFISDCVSQGFYLAMLRRVKLTTSNIQKMGECMFLRDILAKLFLLCDYHQEFYGKKLSYDVLDPLLSSRGFVKLLYECNIPFPERVIHKKSNRGINHVMNQLDITLVPGDIFYHTCYELDPGFLTYVKTRTIDTSLRNCIHCKNQLLTEMRSQGKMSKKMYGCQVHFKRNVTPMFVCVADPYKMARNHSPPTQEVFSKANMGDLISTVGYWNLMLNLDRPVLSWELHESNAISELMASRETYGMILGYIEILKGRTDPGPLMVLVDGEWSSILTLITVSRIMGVNCQFSCVLDQSRNSGAEFVGMVGLKNVLRDEDKRFLQVDQYEPSMMKSHKNVLQIVTGESGTIANAEFFIFPLCSNRAVWKLKNILTDNYVLKYPRIAVDKSIWCIAMKTRNTCSCLYTLFRKRVELKRLPVKESMRRKIDEMIQLSGYPIDNSYEVLTLLPELSQYMIPHSRLDIIACTQIFIKVMRNRKSFSPILTGEEKRSAYIYISLMMSTQYAAFARGMIEHIHEIKYDGVKNSLKFRRKKTPNYVFLAIFDTILEMSKRNTPLLKINGRNELFLSPNNENGIHVLFL